MLMFIFFLFLVQLLDERQSINVLRFLQAIDRYRLLDWQDIDFLFYFYTSYFEAFYIFSKSELVYKIVFGNE